VAREHARIIGALPSPWGSFLVHQRAQRAPSAIFTIWRNYPENHTSKLLTWLKRLLIALLFLALLAINFLTLTHSAFNATLSGLLATALGVQTVSSVLRNKVASHRKAIRAQKMAINKQRAEIDRQRMSIDANKAATHRQKIDANKRRNAAKHFGNRLISRTKRLAAASLAAIPAESIPFIGVSVLIAGTAYELYAACESLRDLEQLYAEMDLAEEVPRDVMASVCDPATLDLGLF
jgi:hypothetical protein